MESESTGISLVHLQPTGIQMVVRVHWSRLPPFLHQRWQNILRGAAFREKQTAAYPYVPLLEIAYFVPYAPGIAVRGHLAIVRG